MIIPVNHHPSASASSIIIINIISSVRPHYTVDFWSQHFGGTAIYTAWSSTHYVLACPYFMALFLSSMHENGKVKKHTKLVTARKTILSSPWTFQTCPAWIPAQDILVRTAWPNAPGPGPAPQSPHRHRLSLGQRWRPRWMPGRPGSVCRHRCPSAQRQRMWVAAWRWSAAIHGAGRTTKEQQQQTVQRLRTIKNTGGEELSAHTQGTPLHVLQRNILGADRLCSTIHH